MGNLILHSIDANLIEQRINDGYINATALCKAANKKWDHYNTNQQTKDFLDELSSTTGIPVIELVQSKQGPMANGGGTWVHPQASIHLAQWASPKFAVQVSNWVVEWMTNKGTVNPISGDGILESTTTFKALFEIGTLIGLEKNACSISANQGVIKLGGHNLLKLLGHTSLIAKEQFFTPTELGLPYNKSAQKMNLLLSSVGLQIKEGKIWIPTEKGTTYSVLLDTSKAHDSGVPVTQIKWSKKVISLLDPADLG
jgi:hypothetical protein